MSRLTRIGAIYRKELIDILRDRRTLIAMVVVPVVLYPLLLLGFLRLADSERSQLREERFVIQVDDEPTRQWLEHVFTKIDDQNREIREPDKKTTEADKNVGEGFAIRVGQEPPASLDDEIQLHVCRTAVPHKTSEDVTHKARSRISIRMGYNEVNVRSRTAMKKLRDILDQWSGLTTRQSLQETLSHLAPNERWDAEMEVILEPLELKVVSIATERQRGGWALGQIVPIILVLMTITGAIYPAIDLTAGERERGTLETLMATPVPGLHLILGKFLVVATVGMLTAILNIASVSATMHFGGLTQAITKELPVTIPLSVLPIIVLSMVPFVLLFAAILVAVCSFARTYKEAQNYVMPVILVALIPAISVTLPTVRLEGTMQVVPVGNMVLLTREMFQGTYTWSQVLVVLLSTLLYAAAALAVAVRLFGQEAVVFADTSAYRTMLQRRFFRPVPIPSLSQALLLMALLFPASFYVNTQLSMWITDDILRMMRWLTLIQFAGLFVLLPWLVVAYCKIDVVQTFRLKLPPARAWVAVMLLGCSSWAIGHELFLLQKLVIPPSQAVVESFQQIEAQLAASPLWMMLLFMAIIPALSEEFLFRGFLLSGLSSGLGKGSAIVFASLIFGIFHFMLDKLPIATALGILLAWLCWQSRSLWPGIVFHALHNGFLTGVLIGAPTVAQWLGVSEETADNHLPIRVLIPAGAMFLAGLAIIASLRTQADNDTSHPTSIDTTNAIDKTERTHV